LLPTDASVAVVATGDERLVQLGGRAVVDFPPPATDSGGADSHEGSGQIAALERLRKDGVEYLLVPYISPSWLDLHPDFVGEVERRFPCVARRRNVGSVFALADTGSPAEETERGQQLRTGPAGRLARWLAGANRHHPRP
jgi:hypothetical protein